MNEKRISIRFNLDDETDKEAWNYLQGTPNGSRQNTVKVALLRDKHKRFEKDELKAYLKELIQELAPVAANDKLQSKGRDEIPTDVMDFMKGL